MSWRVFAAAVAGASHVESGAPCQDAFAHRVAGDWLLAAVCDGAGSQPRSHIGAQLLAHAVVDGLAGSLDGALDAEGFRAHVERAIDRSRGTIESAACAESEPFASYAATLVGVAAGPQGGFFFHIGDGVAAARARADGGACTVSQPENGEYANETYFATGDEWAAHLRVLAFDAPALVALMSDGAAPFAMSKGNAALFPGFIGPVERFLESAEEADGNRALAGTLGDPRTHAITGDDKTLLLALWR
jgi:hypothetical protein